VVVLSLLDCELRKVVVVVVVVMLGGTWVRKGWPFARKHDWSKVIDKGGGLVMSTRPNMFRGSVAVLVMLGGAMVIDETQLAY
jgi:heme O synthase-like polyprenyltransferase